MWDETDYTARLVQAICAVFLFGFAAADAYFVVSNFGLLYGIAGISLFVGSVRLGWRCAWYAVTGKRNVNTDDY